MAKAFGAGNTIVITEWEKGDVFEGSCINCGAEIKIFLDMSNDEGRLFQKTIVCSCGTEYQVLF